MENYMCIYIYIYGKLHVYIPMENNSIIAELTLRDVHVGRITVLHRAAAPDVFDATGSIRISGVTHHPPTRS